MRIDRFAQGDANQFSTCIDTSSVECRMSLTGLQRSGTSATSIWVAAGPDPRQDPAPTAARSRAAASVGVGVGRGLDPGPAQLAWGELSRRRRESGH